MEDPSCRATRQSAEAGSIVGVEGGVQIALTYLSILRQYVERKGGNLFLKVAFPGQPDVILTGLGGDDGRKKAQKKAENAAQSKPKARRPA